MIPERGGWLYRQSAARMIKSLAAFAIFAVLGASVIALPGFAPKVEASEAVALAKADRLEVRSLAQNCFKQVWPNFPPRVFEKRNWETFSKPRFCAPPP